jgi:hypothetical protein
MIYDNVNFNTSLAMISRKHFSGHLQFRTPHRQQKPPTRKTTYTSRMEHGNDRLPEEDI